MNDAVLVYARHPEDVADPHTLSADRDDYVELVRATQDGDWGALDRSGASLRARSFRRLDASFGVGLHRAGLRKATQAWMETMESSLEALSTRSDAELQRGVEASGAARGWDERSQVELFGALTDPAFRARWMERARLRIERTLARAENEPPIGDAVTGFYASVVGRYLARFEGEQIPLPAGMPALVAANVRGARGFMHGHWQAVQGELAAGNRAALEERLLLRRAVCELGVDGSANLLYWAARIYRLAQEDGTLEEQRDAARICLVAARAAREATFDVALTQYLLRMVHLPDDTPVWRQLQDAAGLRFASRVPNGRDVEIDHLLGDPGAYEGRLVEIKGNLVDVRSWTERGGKWSSALTVQGWRRSSPTIDVVLPYSNLPQSGPMEGAPCAASGTVRVSGDGEVKLMLDRLSFAELRTESFLDAMQARLNAYFPLWFRRLNLQFGYVPTPDLTSGSGPWEVVRFAIRNPS